MVSSDAPGSSNGRENSRETITRPAVTGQCIDDRFEVWKGVERVQQKTMRFFFHNPTVGSAFRMVTAVGFEAARIIENSFVVYVKSNISNKP